MPAFAHLNIEEIDLLVELLHETTQADAATDAPPIGRRPAAERTRAERSSNGSSTAAKAAATAATFTPATRGSSIPTAIPAIAPPWGTLTAIDLERGELRWQSTLGDLPQARAHDDPPTGAENYGGPVVTAGGLVFIAATKDEKLRAFDKRTGELLWTTTLPAGGYATPAVYEAGGRQFVVIAAGGGKMGTPSGDSYLAYRLP